MSKAAATDVKNRFGDYLGEVVHGSDPLVIEKHGKPVAVLLSYDDWNLLRSLNGGKVKKDWFEALTEFTENFKRRHPNAKPFSAVELIREIRDEES